MKKSILFFICSACLMVACDKGRTFRVDGNISGAGGQTLYLEQVLLASVAPVDSVCIGDNGDFEFKSPVPADPSFYRLRMGNRVINLGIDSTEQIKITADLADFSVNYTVEGSPACTAIKEITLKQQEVDRDLKHLSKQNEEGALPDSLYVEAALAHIGAVKEFLKPYITIAPHSLQAYYALFQRVGEGFIFAIDEKDDFDLYTLVANAMKLYYPNSEFSANLEKLVLQALSYSRAASGGGNAITLAGAEVSGIVEVALPTVSGEIVKLSEYAKGGVTLLDFTMYDMSNSGYRTMVFGDLYEKYRSKGLKIYQVSFDSDEHVWKNKAANLPWMCVYDKQSVQSRLLTQYNVTDLPTLFLIDGEGDVVKRIENGQELDEALKRYLK